jgi:hypothetical protein
MLAMAHATRGELEAAVQTFERALAAGGPLDDVLRGELAEARSRLARERASRGGESGGTSAR